MGSRSSEPPARTDAHQKKPTTQEDARRSRDDRAVRSAIVALLRVPDRGRGRLALRARAVDRPWRAGRVFLVPELAVPSLSTNELLCAGRRQRAAERQAAKALKQCAACGPPYIREENTGRASCLVKRQSGNLSVEHAWHHSDGRDHRLNVTAMRRQQRHHQRHRSGAVNFGGIALLPSPA
jgi:hypothetical protein